MALIDKIVSGARLAHAHLSGLEDFQQTCKGVPQTLSLGSANSLIEWLVMPQVANLRRSLPNTLFEFYDGRTQEQTERRPADSSPSPIAQCGGSGAAKFNWTRT